MTPRAVIHRYFRVIDGEPLDVDALLHLLSLDADLLSAWLNVLGSDADPGALRRRIVELDEWTFLNLSHAMAWMVASARSSGALGKSVWSQNLRSAALAEALAESCGLPAGAAARLRWRVLLAVSGNIHLQDRGVRQLVRFRGTKPELLIGADVLHRIYAVVEAHRQREGASQLARTLLDLTADQFAAAERSATQHADTTADDLAISVDSDGSWDDELAVLQHIDLIAGLFLHAGTPDAFARMHRLASMALFTNVPGLLLLADGTLTGEAGTVRADSPNSQIAAAVSKREPRRVVDSAETAVIDRQILAELGAAQALAVPLVGRGEALGCVIFNIDHEFQFLFAMQAYARALARWLRAAPGDGAPGQSDRVGLLREAVRGRLREVIHETNNPLTVVRNYLHVLETRIDDPELQQPLQVVKTELKRASDILQSARTVADVDISGADTDDQPLDTALTDLNGLARQAFEIHRGLAEKSDVMLELDLDKGPITVETSASAIAQVLSNLVKNAIEAAGEGETVIVGTRASVYRSGAAGVEFSVEDTGPGIRRDTLAQLFEPKTSGVRPGHEGLGLHVSHTLITKLDGSIDVRTQIGDGTHISVFLPHERPDSG